MGTNYYKVKPLSKEQKEKIIKAINEDKFEINGKNSLYFEGIPFNGDIHIGKSSGGWQFLFDHNDWKYFARNKKSIVDWINDPETGKIVDEYGDEISTKEFWDMVERKKDGMDHHDYYLKHPNKPYYTEPTDFYIEDLRISKHTDFC